MYILNITSRIQSTGSLLCLLNRLLLLWGPCLSRLLLFGLWGLHRMWGVASLPSLWSRLRARPWGWFSFRHPKLLFEISQPEGEEIAVAGGRRDCRRRRCQRGKRSPPPEMKRSRVEGVSQRIDRSNRVTTNWTAEICILDKGNLDVSFDRLWWRVIWTFNMFRGWHANELCCGGLFAELFKIRSWIANKLGDRVLNYKFPIRVLLFLLFLNLFYDF